MIKELLCEFCPNGCRLFVDARGGTSKVSGNFCQQGVAYAYRELKESFPAPFHGERATLSMSDAQKIGELWGMAVTRVHPGLPIQGSPERTLFRTVISDKRNQKFILEEVEHTSVQHKELIAFSITHFKRELPVAPYCKTLDKKCVAKWENRFWMIHPYVEHTHLDRGTFWKDEWRGTAVAKVLSVFHTSKYKTGEESFSVRAYIEKLLADIQLKHPQLMEKIQPIVTMLEENLFPELESLPVSFCHGDSHPLNMLWSESEILALIDWEFSGMKPRIYDLALIVGCVGTENEDALESGFVQSLLTKIYEEKTITEHEWKLFPYLVIALRFNWLSEWLRRDDQEMIDFELFYMNYVIEYWSITF